MARDPISLASKAARAAGSPKTANAIMKNAKAVRNWVKDLPREAQRQYAALVSKPTAGQAKIAYAGSKTRAATKKAQKAFVGGYAVNELVDELFGDSEKKTSAQLEKKLNSVYNKASRKDPYSGGVDAITQKALSKNKEAKEDKKGMSRFEKEFDSARKAGKETFEFKNKKGETRKYTTELKKNNKGGYTKKARTGTMDYRKGGLFR